MLFENESIYEAIRASRRIAPISGKDINFTIAKSVEELGEFSTAVLVEQGFITNKVNEHDAVFNESADVILCIVDILAKLYPNKAASEIYVSLLGAIDRKCEKWEQTVDEYSKK